MNEAQTVFTVFYAIFWGTVANAQPRWKAFNLPLIGLPRTRNRIVLSMLMLNVLPLVYYGMVLLALIYPNTDAKDWTAGTVVATVSFGAIPALAAFSFYRFWMGLVEWSPERYYYGAQGDLPRQLRTRKGGWIIEPTIDTLEIRQSMWWRNLLGAAIYLTVALSPLLVRGLS